MKISLSHRVTSLEESQTIAMAKKTRELKDAGLDVIGLSLGEPDFPTPDFIKEAAKRAIDDDFSHYTAVPGDAGLILAIQKKFERDNGLRYATKEIVASTGAKQSIINVLLSVVNPGDEVILPAPYWVSYNAMVQMADGVAVEVLAGVDQDFKITADQLEAAITPKTRAILFSSPCNPTGAVYTESELRAWATVLEKHPQIVVIADEIYEHIQFDTTHFSFAKIPGMFERTVTVNGVSKGFAMTGWRLGYIGAPASLAGACNKLQGQFTSAPSSISQKAAQAALEADPSTIAYMVDAFKKRRSAVYDRLKNLQGWSTPLPPGAFYLFSDITEFLQTIDPAKGIVSSADFCMYLLNDHHVALVPGEAFGAPGCIRISYAASLEDLNEACTRIEKAVHSLLNK